MRPAEGRAVTIQPLSRAPPQSTAALGTEASSHGLLGDVSDPNHNRSACLELASLVQGTWSSWWGAGSRQGHGACLTGMHGDILAGPELLGVLMPGVGPSLCPAGESEDRMSVIRASLAGDRTCPGWAATMQEEHHSWGPRSQPCLVLKMRRELLPCGPSHLSSAVSCDPECPLS